MNMLRRFMYGRYGVDNLSIGILAFAIFISIISFFTPTTISAVLGSIYYLLVAYCLFRIISRNIQARQQENQIFLSKISPLQAKFTKRKQRAIQSKTHRFYKCPNCKQTIRVPRGKGRIEITCPKCQTRFIKKS